MARRRQAYHAIALHQVLRRGRGRRVGIDKLLDDGEARPTEGAFQGNWWTKEINAEMFTAPLDPWPDDDDLSWVEPNEGRAQPLTKEYLAFHYFMSLRWNNAAM